MDRLRSPQQIDPTAFIAPNAMVLGDVTTSPRRGLYMNCAHQYMDPEE